MNDDDEEVNGEWSIVNKCSIKEFSIHYSPFTIHY